jgi:DNA-binding CsgD family transcriptional regulator
LTDDAPLAISVDIGDAALAERVAALLREARGFRVAAVGEAADVILVEARPSDRAPEPEAPLTQRELEVLQLLAEGASNKTIARKLGISAHTAKFHVGRLLDKLDAVGRTDAVAHAARLGVLHL